MLLRFLWLLIAVAVLSANTLGWMWLRRTKPVIVTPQELAYPCLRIIDGILWERIGDPQELAEINSGRLLNRRADPLLVDSKFRVIEMSKFAMKGSVLGLMIAGPRRVQVDFELILRSDQTSADARSAVHEVLQHKRSILPEELQSAFDPTMSLNDLIDLLAAPEADAGPPP